MSDPQRQPDGNLLLRTLAMPADTNANGDIFGGWIMAQMDIGGGILSKEIAAGRVVTVAVEGMTFHRPVKVGNVVCCYGQCTRIGRTSLSIKLEVWVKPVLEDSHGRCKARGRGQLPQLCTLAYRIRHHRAHRGGRVSGGTVFAAQRHDSGGGN